MSQSPQSELQDAVKPRQLGIGWRHAFALSLVVLVALALRAYRLGEQPLELDELWNAELSTGRGSVHENVTVNSVHIPPASTSLTDAPPWWKVPLSLQAVTHPPLYSIVLRWWRELGGDGDAGMRLLGVLLSTAALVPLHFAVLRLSGIAAAFWTTLMMALATTPIAISQEIRPYGLLLLLQTAVIWQMVRFQGQSATWQNSILFAVTCFAAAWTHYFAIPMLAAIVAAGAFHLDRTSIKRLSICIGAVAAIYVLTWGPQALRQRDDVDDAASIWMKETSEQPYWTTLSRLAQTPIYLITTPRPADLTIARASIVFVVIAVILARKRQDLRFWLFILAGTLGFVALVDLTQQTRMLGWTRYALTACPPMFAIIACLMANSRIWMRHALPAAAVFGCVAGLPEAYTRMRPDYRELTQVLDQRVAADDVVVFLQLRGWEWEAGIQYAMWSHYSRTPPRRCVILDGVASPELVRELRGARTIWLVANPAEQEPLARIPGASVVHGESFAGAYYGSITAVRLNQTIASDESTPGIAR